MTPPKETMMLNELETRRIVQQELAALGGHLLATYHGDTTTPDAEAGGRIYEPELATLGGYLLGFYGQPQETT